ncbi:unnamed protein product [Rhizoctonia solani]|uniref:Intradiol ring-cleavage dioxygenases domain-containing protein n=1 Tax=Rhizoctonia solani TaxID=456999 RepID=A0A8H3CFF0_9AGAM|nr:unnamed protein product [Rhizoctonia solani]CAE6478982.1 unnamed protein product [Rhizoctonia solani]
MSATSTNPSFPASLTSIPLSTRLLSFLSTVIWSLTTENPLIWRFFQGAAHPLADLLGPYYMYGAPNVNIAPGKAVLGATEDLKTSPLFLLSGKVLGPNGEPVEATLDLWQANTQGEYSLSAYRNRGNITTNPSTGSFEILTVPPGIYGIFGAQRVAHIHGTITAPGYQSLTTQLYFCPKNELMGFQTDILTLLRGPRENLVRGWSIPTEKGDRYWDWPQLESSETETMKTVGEWNGWLKNQAVEWQISCGASQVITLNKA